MQLLLRILPLIDEQDAFALKGGTAINLFVRDMPRLSVDIDLTYLPIAPRMESLNAIAKGMKDLSRRIKSIMPQSRITPHVRDGELTGLGVTNDSAQIKIEPNLVLRGSVYSPSRMELCPSAQEMFEMVVEVSALSVPDLYGGKLCAALDRQHPRDLYDVKGLFENEGLTAEVRQAFVIYLASHPRPMHELLNPTLLDLEDVFDDEFAEMTQVAVSYEELCATRDLLIQTLKATLTDAERKFLVSVKQGEPEWHLLPIAGIERLPGLLWKLQNVRRIERKKHLEQLARLKECLGL